MGKIKGNIPLSCLPEKNEGKSEKVEKALGVKEKNLFEQTLNVRVKVVCYVVVCASRR